MRKQKFDPVRKDAMDTHNLGEAEFYFSERVGAVFYYSINLGKKSFKELSEKKYIKRNVFVGWILKMVIIFAGLYPVWFIIGDL